MVQNDLINKKNELKGQLWESLGVKPADNHWYNNSYIVGGLVLGSLIILGGAYYYFYHYKNSDIPVDSISNHDTTNDHSSFSDNEAGTSNDIELQENKPSDSVINTYSDNLSSGLVSEPPSSENQIFSLIPPKKFVKLFFDNFCPHPHLKLTSLDNLEKFLSSRHW